MKIFITGGTGYVGEQLILALVEAGHQIHAICRNPNKCILKDDPRVKWSKGDLTDLESLKSAAEGCDLTIHSAAYMAIWPKDRTLFDKINIEGTKNVLNASIMGGVKHFIFTSTAGSLGPSSGNPIDEKTPRTTPFFNDYERTKSVAEQIVLSKNNPLLKTNVLHLTRVFGPGQLSEGNATTRLMDMIIKKKMNIIPGDGEKCGNYVYIKDVINAHLKAIEHAKGGERYIIGGEDLSFNQFFETTSELANVKQKFRHIPIPLIMFGSHMMKLGAILFGITPKITPEWARRYMYDWRLSSDKAIQELGYQPHSFKEAAKETIDWLKAQ